MLVEFEFCITQAFEQYIFHSIQEADTIMMIAEP